VKIKISLGGVPSGRSFTEGKEKGHYSEKKFGGEEKKEIKKKRKVERKGLKELSHQKTKFILDKKVSPK